MREGDLLGGRYRLLGQIETSGAWHFEPGFRRLDGVALSDLDCSTERLLMALHESAASAGGEVLIGPHCSLQPVVYTFHSSTGGLGQHIDECSYSIWADSNFMELIDHLAREPTCCREEIF